MKYYLSITTKHPNQPVGPQYSTRKRRINTKYWNDAVCDNSYEDSVTLWSSLLAYEREERCYFRNSNTVYSSYSYCNYGQNVITLFKSVEGFVLIDIAAKLFIRF